MTWIKLPSGGYLNLALVTDVAIRTSGDALVFYAVPSEPGSDWPQTSHTFRGDDAAEIKRALDRLCGVGRLALGDEA